MKKYLFLKVVGVSVVTFLLAYVCYIGSQDVFETRGKRVLEIFQTKASYKTFNEDVSFKDVDTIIVKSLTSDVYIEPAKQGDGKISFTTGVDQSSAFKVEKQNHTLVILLAELSQFPDSSVTVKLPKQVGALKIQNKSGDVRVKNIDINQIDVASVHGDIDLQNDHVEEAKLQSVSGDIQSNDDIQKLIVKSVSGDITLSSPVEVPQYEVNTVSGDIRITTPGVIDTVVVAQSVTGTVENLVKSQNQGKGFMRAKSVSGDVFIK